MAADGSTAIRLRVPLGELAIAVALSFNRSRRWGVWASVALHLLLIVALGPLGLKHKPGVLLWNLYFIAQNLILFQDAKATNGEAAASTKQPSTKNIAWLVLVAMLWPVGEAWNYCDHWPAWSVYAPRVEQTALFIHQGEAARLPDSLQTFLKPVTGDPNWLQLRLDHWSLESLDVPLYPQNRFQVAAAEGLVRQFGLTQARIVRYSSANRWTGRRRDAWSQGLGEIERITADYWLGTRVVRPIDP